MDDDYLLLLLLVLAILCPLNVKSKRGNIKVGHMAMKEWLNLSDTTYCMTLWTNKTSCARSTDTHLRKQVLRIQLNKRQHQKYINYSSLTWTCDVEWGTIGHWNDVNGHLTIQIIQSIITWFVWLHHVDWQSCTEVWLVFDFVENK